MRNCIDEGTLQAWFDGELPPNEAASVATHVNACGDCAAMARVVEAESQLLLEGLSPEFAVAVPSERLRQRVETAVAELRRPNLQVVSESRWRGVGEFFGSFRPLAYAAIAATILLAAVIGFVYLKKQKDTTVIVKNPESVTPIPRESPQQIIKPPVPASSPKLMVVHAPKPVRRLKTPEPDATSIAWQERQYEYAIAKLNGALKTQPPMRPALQVDYEYNMAVIDSAIATTRDAARKNPKDPLANQFMLAAYQSKVDFMNQIADARGLEK